NFLYECPHKLLDKLLKNYRLKIQHFVAVKARNYTGQF
ncbi:uncharacterized protein METZ01_LOCUS158261, partial [marine metagenome]